MDITNLSDDVYLDSPYQFKILDGNGVVYSPASRQFSISLSVDRISKGNSYESEIIYDVPPPVSNYTLVVTPYFSNVETKILLNEIKVLRPSICQGNADCFAGFVTKVVDGDTLDIDNAETVGMENIRIRLSLVDTPEKNEDLYDTAKDFTSGLCPENSYVLFDEDDGQTDGSYGRKIGKVYCEGVLLNEQLVKHDLAKIDTRFCEVSEYSMEPWALVSCK
jgi:micrococcal nuclease